MQEEMRASKHVIPERFMEKSLSSHQKLRACPYCWVPASLMSVDQLNLSLMVGFAKLKKTKRRLVCSQFGKKRQ